MIASRPLRFLFAVVLLWSVGRAGMLFTSGLRPTQPAEMSGPSRVPGIAGRRPSLAFGGGARTSRLPMLHDFAVIRAPRGTIMRPVSPVAAVVRPVRTEADAGATRPDVVDDGGSSPVGVAATAKQVPPESLAPVRPATSSGTTDRWSGFAYLFGRSGSTNSRGALAPGGQLGGSQAAARLAYQVDDAGRLAVAARVDSSLRSTHRAEIGAGVDLIPVPGTPLRVSVERRVAVGRDGRNAWSAYAAGGFYRAVAERVELDGYAQAGVVGAKRRDLFADGALRASHRTGIGRDLDLRLGAGAWGAAQPGAARLDLGPRAAVTARLARLPVTLALEGRMRVVGRARPGSGVALTLATDF